MTFGFKSLVFQQDGLWLATDEDVPVRPVSLHLVGHYKVIAEAIEAEDSLGLSVQSDYILGGRTGRAIMGQTGIKP